ncbi:ketopantoate reductase family protein [Rhodopseudomonas pseudopalustris]|uniref:2-dehydropantoate 2-reductase n=1 Tax=Rhodopseudomonas pseudopalustris TaxID=1513892 RepID=A0A1H8W943_9BRAD|nr:2-dehydropantoate 2-reductase [Rhodopseudomonas pseudopalustris]SEP24149.1 ketopantoate reductase [Rhodopseudomonas pseudopalustris]
MKVAVMGAGAVGCYFGALLAQAGHDVTLIGRPNHVAAINADGLLLETRNGKTFIPLRAATDPASLDPPDLVLFCVKSADTEAAGAALAPRLRPDTAILSLQNGVDNAQRLSAAIDHPVIAAVVYVGTEMAGPGHVRHHGRGELLIGASPRSEALAEELTDAKIPTAIAADIDQALWSKLLMNCAYNALSAVADIAYGPIFEVEGARDVVVSVITECAAVARASGVVIPNDMLETALALPASMPNQKSSTAQDLARGKPSEIDFLNGAVVRKGAALGIPTPTNQALQVMVKLAERSRGIGRYDAN